MPAEVIYVALIVSIDSQIIGPGENGRLRQFEVDPFFIQSGAGFGEGCSQLGSGRVIQRGTSDMSCN